ncbi:Nse4 C-terminal-domain-containing protein [Jimgerdemannia flammicorona]|uniref:Non-structural maintenance of chromosomes element 4 n=1 Tax=Jimgerdemannia flammicorona TaxID=994334 RepID=A0A433Q5E8_9FUNG|nr:Nse4 C-terminal-domain-containing protein [Jimgerdemannia flammicorona]
MFGEFHGLFRLGPLSVEQKTRKVHRVARLERNKGDLVQPQQLKESDIVRNVNQTTDNVSLIRHILQDRGPMGFFEFVVNPESFSQTVENIFYLSFLIRDGEASLKDVDGNLMLDYHNPPTNEEYEDGLTKKQLIMEMDMAMWREIVENFGITEPMIPTRERQELDVGGKWYA